MSSVNLASNPMTLIGIGVLLVIGLIVAVVNHKNSGTTRPEDLPPRAKDVVQLPKDGPKKTPNEEDNAERPMTSPKKKPDAQGSEVVEPQPNKEVGKTPKKEEVKTKPIPDPLEEQRKKEALAESDARFRLSAIKTFMTTGKPEVALRYAKELVRLHPDTPAAREAQGIIDRLSKMD
jgi:hypothetical protein